MRRRKKAYFVTVLPIDRIKHGADGTLAVRSGDMNHGEFRLWISYSLGKQGHPLNPKMGALIAQSVEVLQSILHEA
jgi:hypothetical protein